MWGQAIHFRVLLCAFGMSLCASLIYGLADVVLARQLVGLPAPFIYTLFLILALGVVGFAVRMRREFAFGLGRDIPSQTLKALAFDLLKNCGFAAGVAVAFACVCALFSLIVQAVLGTVIGRAGAVVAVTIFSQVLPTLTAPVWIALFLAPALGLKRDGPIPTLQASRHLLGVLLILSAAFFAAAHLASLALNLIPQATLRAVLHFCVNLVGGVAWAACILSVAEGDVRPRSLRRVLDLPQVIRVRSRLASALSKGCACLVAFILTFSLGGKVSFAHAAEVQERIAQEQAERLALDSSLADEAPRPQQTDPRASAESAAASPSDPTAAAPEDFYGTELDEAPGEPVARSGEAVIFQRDARRFTTVIGGRDLVYTREDGTLEEIDNTLVPQEGASPDNPTYANAANSFTAELPAKMDEGRGLSLTAQGHRVGLVPLGGDFTVSAVEDAAIRYSEVHSGIDYQYTLVGSLIKEDIILKREVAPRTFQTRLDLPAGIACALEEGAVALRDAQGALIATITAPDMEDAAGEVSDGIELSLTEDGQGAPVIALDIDWAWANAPERAYPVRVDPSVSIGKSATTITVVESAWDRVIGDSNFLPVGYDDGKATASGAFNPGGRGHEFCRVYAKFAYDFKGQMFDSRIDSATFSLYQFTTLSHGANLMGAYRMDAPWSYNTLKWNNQISAPHTFVSYQYARTSVGYVSWDVREAVNAWAQGIAAPNGLCLKSDDERNMQCEVFRGNSSTSPPKLEVNWSVPDPVDTAYPLNSTTVSLRAMTEKSHEGMQAVDGVFADGVATPTSVVGWQLNPRGDAGASLASKSYKYPDSSAWEGTYPNASKYKDKLSNWQTTLFAGLEADTLYSARAQPVLGSSAGAEVRSEEFLIYKAKATDTLPFIAKHYGVALATIAADNHVHDSLSIKDNTLFIRAPKTSAAYDPGELSVDQKKRIDSALMGRGKHCEYGYEPVNLNTGNFTMERTDAAVPEVEGEFTLTRTYNSKSATRTGAFGRGWSCPWEASLSQVDANTVAYSAGDGKVYFLEREAGDTFSCAEDPSLSLEAERYLRDDVEYIRWSVKRADGSQERFNEWGLVVSRTSALGLTTAIERDKDMKVAAIVSPSGIRFEPTWDALGRVVRLTLPGGAVCSFAYDGAGNLISATEPNGATSHYAYDDAHRMTSWVNPDGHTAIVNAYDGEGRVMSQTDALGNTVTLAYAEGSTTAADAMGNVTVYRYDESMRTTSITYPDGTSVFRGYDAAGNLAFDEEGRYTYDANGNLTSSLSPDGWATAYSYDGQNRLVGQVNPDGEAIAYAYSDAGDLISQTSSSGESFAFAYDGAHRLISATDADGVSIAYTYTGPWVATETDGAGNTTSYAYDAMGRCVSVTDPAGNVSRTMYDGAGNKIGETDGAGAHTAFELTAMGYLSALVDARGYRTEFTLDAKGQAVAITLPTGAVESYAYDANGNQVSHTDGAGRTEYMAYDGRGRRISHTDLAGSTTSYGYDERGNMVREEREDGAVRTYEYDRTYHALIAETDPLGNRTDYALSPLGLTSEARDTLGTVEACVYSAGGRLVSATDGAGATTRYAYTAAGRLASVDGSGRVWAFAYDSAGRLASATDPEGGLWGFSYDAAGDLALEIDPAGNTTAYAYDGAHRQTSVTDAEGNTATVGYDGRGNVISQTDGAGGRIDLTYGPVGEVLSVADGAGNMRTFGYDMAGNRISSTDARGYTTLFEYDALGRMTASTDPLGNRTEQAFDGAGNVIVATDVAGNTSRFAYDLAGNQISATDVAGVALHFAYDMHGRMVGASDGAKRHWEFAYDGEGRQVSKTDMLGRCVTTEYDPWGAVISATDAGGATTRFAYNGLGLETSRTDALGHTAHKRYDASGNLTLEEDAAGNRTAYRNDRCGRPVAVVDGAGAATTLAYDGAGRILAMTDGDGYRRTYAYDAAGNLANETDALGNACAYEYDASGNLTRFTMATGRSLSFEYDACGRMVAWSDPAGAETSYSYDALGNVTAAKDPLSHATRYAYDARSLVTSVTDPLGSVTELAYDEVGNLTSVTDPLGAVQTYRYDVADRLISTVTPLGRQVDIAYDVMDRITAITDNAGLANSFAYDKLGRLVKATDSNGNVRRWSYDAVGNAVAYRNAAGEKTAVAYDGVGRPVSVTDGTGATARFAYDGRGNLVRATSFAGIEEEFGYDAAGNLISRTDAAGTSTWRYDADGRIVAATDAFGTSQAFSYDEAGRLIASVKAASAEGAASAVYSMEAGGSAPEGTQALTYGYDAAGNMTSATDGAGAGVSYAYDAARRIASVTSGTGRTDYTRDGAGNITSVTDGRNNTSAYGYDAAGNLISATTAEGVRETLERDAAGRVTSYTDGAGGKVRYAYDGEGNLTSKAYPGASGRAVGYAYDGEGRVVSRTDWTGEATREYDAAGRLMKETDGEGRALAYGYDGDGRVVSVTYPDGTQASYGYDGAGHLASIGTDAGTWDVSCDAQGRPEAITRPDGSSVLWERDGLGRISSVENRDSADGLVASYEYTYDPAGRIASETWKTQGAGSGTRAFSYDQAGRLATVEGEDDSGPYTEAFAYDGAGNRTEARRTGSDPSLTTFAYDKDNRLISAEGDSGKTTYTYDDAGNLVSQAGPDGEMAYDYGVENRLEAVTEGDLVALALAYDGDGNRVWQADGGAPTSGAGAGGADLAGALPDTGDAMAPIAFALCAGLTGALGIANPAASSALAQLLASKWYSRGRTRDELNADDILGEDVASAIGDGGAIADMEERAYVNTSLADVTQPLSVVGEDGSSVNHLYLFDGGTSESPASAPDAALGADIALMAGIAEAAGQVDVGIEASLEPSGLPVPDAGEYTALPLAEGETSYGFDGRGSVTAAFSASGTIEGMASFSVTGVVEAVTGTLPSRGWNAEEADGATGLVFLRARFMIAGASAFTSQDTYLGHALDPISQNRYAYCAGDPVNMIDPTGHISVGSAIRKGLGLGLAELLTNAYNSVATTVGLPPVRSTPIQIIESTEDPAMSEYIAWSFYNNGWISFEAAKKYCGSYLRMGALAPKPLSNEACLEIVEAFKRGVSCGAASLDNTGNVTWNAGGIGHTALDLAGLVPVAGSIADSINAVWYLVEGDWTNAAASGVSAIPGIGDAAGAGKLGYKGIAAGVDYAKVGKKATKNNKPLSPNQIRDLIRERPSSLPKTVIRYDSPKDGTGGQDHIHFSSKPGSNKSTHAMNKDGTVRHGTIDDFTRKEMEWMYDIGFLQRP